MEPGDKLDRVARALATNNYEGLSDRELADSKTYFETPHGKAALNDAWDKLGIRQSFVVWDFSDPKLDPIPQFKSIRRFIANKLGSYVSDGYVLDCGSRFHAAFKKLPAVSDAFEFLVRASTAEVPFIVADDVHVRDAYDKENGALIYPKGIDPSRLRECSVEIVGLNDLSIEKDDGWHLDLDGADNSIRLPRDVYGKPLPKEKPKLPLITRHMLENMSPGDVAETAMRALDEVLLLKAKFKTERSQAWASHNKLLEMVQGLQLRVGLLEDQIAALRGTPPEPSDEETLGRAMGFGR